MPYPPPKLKLSVIWNAYGIMENVMVFITNMYKYKKREERARKKEQLKID